jgi:hypothetical protein
MEEPLEKIRDARTYPHRIRETFTAQLIDLAKSKVHLRSNNQPQKINSKPILDRYRISQLIELLAVAVVRPQKPPQNPLSGTDSSA